MKWAAEIARAFEATTRLIGFHRKIQQVVGTRQHFFPKSAWAARPQRYNRRCANAYNYCARAGAWARLRQFTVTLGRSVSLSFT
jgi:hypothetical protein